MKKKSSAHNDKKNRFKLDIRDISGEKLFEMERNHKQNQRPKPTPAPVVAPKHTFKTEEPEKRP